MKSLSLARPLILMIIGLPGAGKTYFAKRFSDMFGAPLVGVDRFRFELFGDPKYAANEQTLLHHLGAYMMTELIKTGRSFIVDGYCNTRLERKQLEAFAKKHNYDTLVIWVQTDPATTVKRSVKRNPKNPDDAHNYSLTSTQYELLSKRFSPPAAEPIVVISGRHTFATQAKTVLRRLTASHTQQAQRAHSTVRVERKTPATAPVPRPIPVRRNVVVK